MARAGWPEAGWLERERPPCGKKEERERERERVVCSEDLHSRRMRVKFTQ